MICITPWRTASAIFLTISLLHAGISADSAERRPLIALEHAFPRLSFDRPLYLCPYPGTDELVVVEQAGVVHRLPNTPEVILSDRMLDITSRVSRRGNEEGLLGLAFSPDFQATGHFFVMYSASAPRRNVISRFTVDPDTRIADPQNEHIILEVPQPYANHNGGMLEFGAEGYLYIALGDGGGAGDPHGHAQNLETLLGSILRIDVSGSDSRSPYRIPPDNPFTGVPGARGEIWACGLRNAWRFSFDSESHELWAGDVGQNKWEEIDLIVKGGNYGWNLREGFEPFRSPFDKPGLVAPIVAHPRRESISITGGYVYRGRDVPAIRGAYIYGDFGTGLIWLLRYDSRRKRIEEHLEIGKSPPIASFGLDHRGELYITAFDGRIYRIVSRE